MTTGCSNSWTEGATPWLTPLPNDPVGFGRILEGAEAADMIRWAFSEPFMREWGQRKAAGKPLPALGGGSRGPATIMTSVLRPETVFLWMYDHPGLMRRFRDVLARKMVELNRALRSFSGNTASGWWFADDNSALFNWRLYREYCVPVLEAVLNEFAPGGSTRYQHSDSASSRTSSRVGPRVG
jgi:hypothetical protein